MKNKQLVIRLACFLLQFLLMFIITFLPMHYIIQIICSVVIYCVWRYIERLLAKKEKEDKFKTDSCWLFYITLVLILVFTYITSFYSVLSRTSSILIVSFLCIELSNLT